MLRRARLAAALLAVLLAAAVAGCSDDATVKVDPESLPHTHGSLPAGDGLRQSYVGYSLDDVVLPSTPGVAATYSFRIGTFRGTTQTEFLDDLTKKMHVYLIRDDLAVFRHVHPEMAADGTWSGTVTVPTAGDYRLVTEFVAKDDGGNGDHVVLGVHRVVGHRVAAVEVPPATNTGTAGGLTASLVGKAMVGPASLGNASTMKLALSFEGKPADLGTYLGVYAHVTGVDTATGGIVHMHPLGAPLTSGDTSVLTFHTTFPEAGVYRLFVQVRVSGIVRVVPVSIEVNAPPV